MRRTAGRNVNGVLIESDWNLKLFSLYEIGWPVISVLIESDWNLKYPQKRMTRIQNSRINRIRLEFKAESIRPPCTNSWVLIESDWNLKMTCDGGTAFTTEEVLIESDWNLKDTLVAANVFMLEY